MAWQVQWYIPLRVILWIYQGPLTVEDVHAATADSRHFVLAGEAPVHVIIDFSDVTDMQLDVHDVATTPVDDFHYKIGWIAYVDSDDNMALRHLVDTIANIRGNRYRWFQNRDDAFAFLKQIDMTIE